MFCVRNLLPLMLIDWFRHTKSVLDLFLYARNLYSERLKPVFECKITFWISVLVLWIHKGYYVIKKRCEMFVLKLFDIQKNMLYLISNVFHALIQPYSFIYTLFETGVQTNDENAHLIKFLYLKCKYQLYFSKLKMQFSSS